MSDEGLENAHDALVDMSADDVLTFAETRHTARLNAERDILRAAYQWAILHSPDRLPATDKRGRERAKPAGAEGTPLITEYAAATFVPGSKPVRTGRRSSSPTPSTSPTATRC